jgi:type IV pilus assembly protein PilB
MGFDPKNVAGRKFRRARGCRSCDGTGYRGRIAAFELLEMDASIRDLVFHGSGLEAVRERATASGALRPLVADGARKVLRGDTSVNEIVRVTRLAAAEDL